MSSTAKLSRLLAVDPSLHCSGWACFDVQSSELLCVGIIKAPPASLPMGRRLESLQDTVNELFSALQLGESDYFVCEGPAPLVLNPQSALKVERVRGIFEAVARACGVCIPGRLNPRTVQSELLGMKGRQLPRSEVKLWAKKTAQQLYGDKLRHSARAVSQDIVDAALIGTLALARIKISKKTNQDVYQTFQCGRTSSRGSRWRGGYSGWNERTAKQLLRKKA